MRTKPPIHDDKEMIYTILIGVVFCLAIALLFYFFLSMYISSAEAVSRLI